MARAACYVARRPLASTRGRSTPARYSLAGSPCMSNTHNRLTAAAPARCPLELREQARARARSGAVAVEALSKPERLAGSKSRIEHKEGSNNMEQFVGIDVSKAWLDGEAVPPSWPIPSSNDMAGVRPLWPRVGADPPHPVGA